MNFGAVEGGKGTVTKRQLFFWSLLGFVVFAIGVALAACVALFGHEITKTAWFSIWIPALLSTASLVVSYELNGLTHRPESLQRYVNWWSWSKRLCNIAAIGGVLIGAWLQWLAKLAML